MFMYGVHRVLGLDKGYKTGFAGELHGFMRESTSASLCKPPCGS